MNSDIQKLIEEYNSSVTLENESTDGDWECDTASETPESLQSRGPHKRSGEYRRSDIGVHIEKKNGTA